jgi:hypothetical protein
MDNDNVLEPALPEIPLAVSAAPSPEVVAPLRPPQPARCPARRPAHHVDVLPSLSANISQGGLGVKDEDDHPAGPPKPVKLKQFKTKPNEHGLVRIYPHRPTFIPDMNVAVEDLCDGPTFGPLNQPPPQQPWYASYGLSSIPGVQKSPFGNVVNKSWYKLLDWWSSTITKSRQDFQRLIDILSDPNFKVEEIKGINVAQELDKMEKDATFKAESGWKETTIRLPVPCPRTKAVEKDAFFIEIKGVFYRSLLDIMKETCTGPRSGDIHTTPFHQLHL